MTCVASLTAEKSRGEAKASVNSANYKQLVSDPKPGELTMSRVNAVERQPEARTVVRCNVLG